MTAPQDHVTSATDEGRTKHTLGPWHVGREYDAMQLRPRIEILRDVVYVEGVRPTTYIIGEVRYPTATGNTVGAEERAANARLIASAPELLEALQRIAAEDPGGYFAAIALPAIRKATGGDAA